jgi:hypothetical protein
MPSVNTNQRLFQEGSDSPRSVIYKGRSSKTIGIKPGVRLNSQNQNARWDVGGSQPSRSEPEVGFGGLWLEGQATGAEDSQSGGRRRRKASPLHHKLYSRSYFNREYINQFYRMTTRRLDRRVQTVSVESTI